jgi:hypothetical protein
MTNRTLYLHAGGSKTGSSAIQNFLEANYSRLRDLGFSYENRVNINDAYSINSGNGLLLYSELSKVTITDDEIDSLLLSYFGQCNLAICSCEYFAELCALNWKRLFESTIRLHVKLKVIFYVRNVIPFFQSAYDQVIKRHGVWDSFDNWVAQPGKVDRQNVRALRTIADEIPLSNIKVNHYDSEKSGLISGFLDNLGIDTLFENAQNEQKRLVNRSLTDEERETLKIVNKTLGQRYSAELSDLLIKNHPECLGRPAAYNKTTVDLLFTRYNNDLDWVNNTFFNGQSVVTVLPIKKNKQISLYHHLHQNLYALWKHVRAGVRHESQKDRSEGVPIHNDKIEIIVLVWALDKLKTIRHETGERIFDVLIDAANKKSHLNIDSRVPADFDVFAYLLLNQDVVYSGIDPIQHYINHGKQEGRLYKLDATSLEARRKLVKSNPI